MKGKKSSPVKISTAQQRKVAEKKNYSKYVPWKIIHWSQQNS